MTEEELLAALTAYAVKPSGKRGRPRANTIGDFDTGMRRFVIYVFVAQLHIGRGRGSLTTATHQVADRFGLTYEGLKRAVSRRPDLRAAGRFLYEHDPKNRDWRELQRRMHALPGDVRARLGDFTPGDLLQLLRDLSIDGNAPQEFCDMVRARFNVPDVG